MMSRRRALLINAVANSSAPPYDVRIISSLLMHQSTSTVQYSSWYTSTDFIIDTINRVFTLSGPDICMLDYAHNNVFQNHVAGNYCVLGSATGNTMYYFPTSCTASYEYDEATGLYSVTAHGNIQMFTPITST